MYRTKSGITTYPGEALRLSVLHDVREVLRIEARSANESSVDLFFAHQGEAVIGLHAASVQDAQVGGEIVTEGLGGFVTNHRMGVGRGVWCRRDACADGPHRFVGNRHTRRLLCRYA